MPHEISNPPAPGTPEWRKIVTASKIPIILGLSPFKTPAELWQEMTGLVEPDVLEGDHLAWGHLAEDSLAAFWQYKQPQTWRLSTPRRDSRGYRTRERAYTDPDLPFDNMVSLDVVAYRGQKRHIIECKTSNSREKWAAGVPAAESAQALSQMGISGIHNHDVVVQVGSTVPTIHPTEWDENLFTGVVDAVKSFVDTLGNDVPPEPDPTLLDELVAQQSRIGEGEQDVADDPHVIELTTIRSEIATLTSREAELKARIEADYKDVAKLTIGGDRFASWQAGRFSQSRVPAEFKHLLKDPAYQTTKFDSAKLKSERPDVYAAAIGDPTLRYA